MASGSNHGDEAVDAGRGNIAIDIVNKILALGVDGLGPYESAVAVAEEALSTHGDVDIAIERLLGTHRRYVGAAGFASGLGGLVTLPVAIPADITVMYASAARMSAAIAHLRGYDVQSEEVRTAVLVSLVGTGASAGIGRVGAEIGEKMAVAALKRLPGTSLTAINRAVGFRLLTKFGTKGVVNLGRLVPFAGAGIGAAVNVVTINHVHKYAKSLFTSIPRADDDIVEGEVL